MSLIATDGSNRVGEQSPQPEGRHGGPTPGDGENCVRHCNPPHVVGMNLRSFFFLFFLEVISLAASRSYLQHGEALLSQCDLLLWGTDSLLDNLGSGHVDSVAAVCRNLGAQHVGS